MQSSSDSFDLSVRFTRRTATVTISAPEAACARAISWKLRYFPVPTMRRELKARPAMTKLSGMEDLVRILDLSRPADKSQACPKGGARLAIRWIPARRKLLLDLFNWCGDQRTRGRSSPLKSTPMPNE